MGMTQHQLDPHHPGSAGHGPALDWKPQSEQSSARHFSFPDTAFTTLLHLGGFSIVYQHQSGCAQTSDAAAEVYGTVTREGSTWKYSMECTLSETQQAVFSAHSVHLIVKSCFDDLIARWRPINHRS